MVPSVLRASLLLSLAAPAALAQSQQLVPPGELPEVRRVDPDMPRVRVVYDYTEQRIRSVEAMDPDRLALGSYCYDNSGGPKFASVVTYPGQELVDWGVKQCRESGLVRSFTVMYLSSTPIGGPGGAMSIGFFQGTRGWGELGTEVFRHTVTGLPRGYGELVVDLGTHPIHLADGPIGWSILQVDGQTGPILVTAPSALLGTVDALDLYAVGPATTDAYVGTYNYGGCSATPWLCASLFLQLEEVPRNQVAAAFVLNGTGVNPETFAEILPARLGGYWSGRIDLTMEDQMTTTTQLLVSGASIAPISYALGELLVDPAALLMAPVFSRGGYVFPVPADTALAGTRIFLQGVVHPGGPAPMAPYLTNALRVRIGY